MKLTDGNIDRLFRQPPGVQTFIAVHFNELKSFINALNRF